VLPHGAPESHCGAGRQTRLQHLDAELLVGPAGVEDVRWVGHVGAAGPHRNEALGGQAEDPCPAPEIHHLEGLSLPARLAGLEVFGSGVSSEIEPVFEAQEAVVPRMMERDLALARVHHRPALVLVVWGEAQLEVVFTA